MLDFSFLRGYTVFDNTDAIYWGIEKSFFVANIFYKGGIMKDLNTLWKAVLDKLELTVSNVSFIMWFKPIKVLDLVDNKHLVIAANTTSAKNQISRNYFEKLSSAVTDIFGTDLTIEVLDPTEEIEYIKLHGNSGEKEVDVAKNPFNSKYTFNNFVVGNSNQFVYAACQAVAEHPGEKFNPLFIYGGVGLGKTHLLHAMGNYFKEFSPNLNVKYVTCEQFTNDYIESLGSSSNNSKSILEFRSKYRNLDVLMVDDIQFISKKTSTQEEFFHTFNELYQNNKQIIITSDRPPKEIETLADRLRSRFSSGLIQDIQQPELETRIAILRKKCQLENYSIDDDVINYIAEKINTNIRELEGMLSKVHFLANLLNKPSATMEDAIAAFDSQLEEDRNDGLSTDDIIDAVCKYFDISKQDIIGKKKSKDVVEPRMIAIYLISEILEIPLVSIGKIFGGRDHTTIMHSRDKITDELKTSLKVQSYISEIRKMLKGG